MKFSLNLKSDTPFVFPPEGHRVLFRINARSTALVIAALLAANCVYALLVTHNSVAFSAVVGLACLLVAVLMTVFPTNRFLTHYNATALGLSTADRSGSEKSL
jgi:uncharacterized membrane protein